MRIRQEQLDDFTFCPVYYRERVRQDKVSIRNLSSFSRHRNSISSDSISNALPNLPSGCTPKLSSSTPYGVYEVNALRGSILNFFKIVVKKNDNLSHKSLCRQWDSTYWPGIGEYSDVRPEERSIKAWIWLTEFHKHILENQHLSPIYVDYSDVFSLSAGRFIDVHYDLISLNQEEKKLVLYEFCSPERFAVPLSKTLSLRTSALALWKTTSLDIEVIRVLLDIDRKKVYSINQDLDRDNHKQTEKLLLGVTDLIDREVFYPSVSADCKECPYNNHRCP